jgi:hypothetical protein
LKAEEFLKGDGLTIEHFRNIYRIMAIRRCPYCKAIIDEGSEYCSNCGTQLLFPEDEYVEEEVPGEEVVDEDETEPVSEKEKTDTDKQGDITEEKPDEPITEKDLVDEVKESFQADETEKPEEEEVQPPSEEEEGPSFSTKDLEQIIDSEEKEKEEIEKFLDSLKDEREEWNGEVPPTDELPPWAEQMKEDDSPATPPPAEEPEREQDQREEEKREEGRTDEEKREDEETRKEESEEIVPEEEYAVKEEEEPPEPEEKYEEEATEADRDMPDTGMGLPEGVEQKDLPYKDKPTEFIEESRKKPPHWLSVWLKSRAFDVLFIAAIWIVTLHIASRMMQTNVFKLISGAALSVLAFYVILLAVYLFLFFMFLGQTLGDHLFIQEE